MEFWKEAQKWLSTTVRDIHTNCFPRRKHLLYDVTGEWIGIFHIVVVQSSKVFNE